MGREHRRLWARAAHRAILQERRTVGSRFDLPAALAGLGECDESPSRSFPRQRERIVGPTSVQSNDGTHAPVFTVGFNGGKAHLNRKFVGIGFGFLGLGERNKIILPETGGSHRQGGIVVDNEQESITGRGAVRNIEKLVLKEIETGTTSHG